MTMDSMEGYALSPRQERAWSLQQTEPGAPYRAQCVVRILGALNLPLFTDALQQVSARHEILRTTFQRVPGMTFPLQVPGPVALPEWTVEDWGALAAQEQADRLATLWDAMWQSACDLTRSPVWQLRLARLAPMHHLCLLSLPALSADRVTVTNLVRELQLAYGAGATGETLAAPPMQYVDFAAWHHALLTAEAGMSEKTSWQQQLVPELLQVRLPGEQLVCGAPFTAATLPVSVDTELAARITACAQRYHTSTAVFLLACWALLLRHHLGQHAVLIGMVHDGRTYEPLQDAMGLFATALPLPCQVTDSEPFHALLEQLHATTQEAVHRQEYFTWEEPTAGEEPGMKALPLCFEFIEHPPVATAAAVTFRIERLETCMEPFKLKLVGMQQGGALSAALHYDAAALPRTMVACLAEQWHTLLGSASQQPETPGGQLTLLSDAERQRLLVTFNRTHTPWAPPHCLHHLFEAQVARTPDRLAAVCGDASLTYAALNARANQLAHHLQQLGVGPQVRVGICLERSLEMLVGIFGILKAGGAYVPLDPTYPPERLAFMAADVQAPVLLTQKRFLPGFPQYGPDVVCLDAAWEDMGQYSTENPVSAVTPAHLAYVIYTSGSTGQPRGVLVTHANVVHSTRARLIYYQQAVQCFLLLSPFAFDSSVAGLFGTLCQGGTLLLPTEGYQGDLGHLTTLIARHHVSHLLSLPSLYALLLEQAPGARIESLQNVIVAGEICPRPLVRRHYERLPSAALFNEYGPTEGTVWSSVHHCQAHERAPAVAIGQPLANTQIYLLNARLQPVPLGTPGELYLGGDGVSAGYHNHAALTAERFLPNPYSMAAGARLYRSGDLGRYRPDGTIEFLGRTDHQVKLRGFRIELGEIAAALQEHPAIHEAVVVAREVAAETRLLAYLVPTAHAAPAAEELRRFLHSKLPAYMVPALFIALAALPLAPNGKVDLQALPPADTFRPETHATYIAPATAMECTLASIWQQVLRVENPGIHDNFFDLGGHSLAMVQVHSQLQNDHGSALSLVDMFRYPTIHALASYLSQQTPAATAAETGEERATLRRDAVSQQRQRRQERRHAVQGAPYEDPR